MAEFWKLPERSAEETTDPAQGLDWLAYRLSHGSPHHIADFQPHPAAARRPIDDYATWGAANQIMDRLRVALRREEPSSPALGRPTAWNP
ncbi:DUF4240 domain-containing protein [Micromonospora sp. NPDC048986]|uniref:DUF4240 domain-containing protein n=1 Tax=Micromonospora sp. NPDC048986 TaxID=3155644 RepID=UPI00340DF0D9